ncbi:methyl-accepting chemotaxis protein [Oceanospirillum sediminis]|uniref:Methyl-accepting chemotaxis protein n=1 Tax=Oceanospirillum sediminis TaxID=2760088 RepID=A0A839IPE5_9GAMM|nr:methyl-accepting chemotaxis protein [Oceanospirillum sediminis]MBB1486327.1 methyl-accepting chemotaxis protein [Oceanospirillum sediminis]
MKLPETYMRLVATLPLLAAISYGYLNHHLNLQYTMLLLIAGFIGVLVPVFIPSRRHWIASESEEGEVSTASLNAMSQQLISQYPESSTENRTGQSLQQLFGMARALGPVSSQTAIATAEVSWLADKMNQHLVCQKQETEKIVQRLESITVTMHQVSVNAASVTDLAVQAKVSSRSGRQELEQTISQMREISSNTDHTLRLINDLNEKSERIQDVTRVIEGIAEQTNLLALNAAIEAARAGEHGRGFAVVADEVRNLASRTADSTQQVGRIVEEIQSSTREVVKTIESLVTRISTGSEKIAETGVRLEQMSAQFDEVEDQISGIAEGVSQSYSHVEEISASVKSLKEEVAGGHQQMNVLAKQADQLMHSAEKITATLSDHAAEGQHYQAYQTCLEGARRIQEVFEQAISKGQITFEALFNRTYQPIAGSNIGRCSSHYDQFTDQVLPSIQEELLQRHNYGYAILLDDHCYIPTHNRQYSHPETGDPSIDAVQCRGKRIFDNPVGVRGARNKEKLLLQTYKRDTGEVLHDLSVPVVINGRHWGAFRVGYLPE